MKEPEDAGKYQVNNDGTTQGQVIGDNPIVHQHFYATQEKVPSPTQPEHVRNIPALSSIQRQNRERLLKRVRAIWIEGLLEQSLHRAAWIDLHLQEQPDALENPWRLEVQELNHTPRPLPIGTSIVEVYDEADGELLILGEPGAGKTTLLLELTRTLLERAEKDEQLPMPIVLNLSSWAEKRQSLRVWLVEELRTKYQVPRKLGQSWIKDYQILPLLDGLDEVPSTDRLACVEAINTYQQEHSLLPIVVCSRSIDYLALGTQILLQSAVTIQPLTLQQTESYFLNAGEQLAAVRVALHEDPVLQELVTTPLMLNVLTLTYQGISIDQLRIVDSLKIRQRQVFSAYIERMLQRRGTQNCYTLQQTIYWLAWLAKKMLQYNQTQFYIENLQPTWLANRRVRITYHSVVSLLIGLLTGWFLLVIFGLHVFVISGIMGEWNPSMILALATGQLTGLLFLAMVIGQLIGFLIGFLKRKIDLVEATTWTWRGLWLGLRVGSLVGIAAGILTSYAAWISHGQVTFGIWSRVSFVEVDGAHSAIVSGLIQGGTIGFLVGLITMLLRGFSSTNFDEQYRSRPNQGIWRSARNGGLFAGIAFLVSTLITVLLVFLSSETWISHATYATSPPPPYLYIVDLWGFLMSAIELILILAIPLVGLSMGGRTAIRHVILRLFLWRSKLAPWKYIQFLDYAAERILLRKVGGGYIFVHRLLLEYFATLDNNTSQVQKNYATLLRAMGRNEEAKHLEEEQ